MVSLPSSSDMAQFCDVALPVPLHSTFTYKAANDFLKVGARVLVPFRKLRLAGVVVRLHDIAPPIEAKSLIEVLDPAPVLDPTLLRLGEWIAHYYIAPLGEVYRAMLPLGAEIKRIREIRITEKGMEALYRSAREGSSRRTRKSVDEQMVELAVLNYLADGEQVREERVRALTGATGAVLDDLLRRGWIERHDASQARDATRLSRVAVLKNGTGTLNLNQQAIVSTLAAAGGRASFEKLRLVKLPRTTLKTLIRRGIVEVVAEPVSFSISTLKPASRSPVALDFNAAQRSALQQILHSVEQRKFSVSLLHGVTGSGKTAVYLAAMKAVLGAGRSAIMLVPEIGLTPAVAAQLHQTFGDEVAILHSALTDAERAEQWHRIQRGQARAVVGTRSAVFAPVSDLALIVVDEEHDGSYKQEETPRYNARDVAVMRAKMSDATVILGSATPSLESFRNSQSGKYQLIELADRVEQRPLPEVEIVDMRQEFLETGQSPVISRKLAAEIGERLARREQIIVLLNRRGYAPIVLCRSCGETVQCSNCAIALTHHKRERRLQCHYCGYMQPVPQRCSNCDSEYVYFIGAGSEKLEELLHSMFPQARIGRLDRDTVRNRHDFERVLGAFHAGDLDLLVGTQMIAKGHDVHGVTLVGVVGADAALGFPDFRAAERTFQLLAQVAGRAGRGASPGKVILQALFPEHYAVQFAARHDYAGFYDKELRFRTWMQYPPFSALANVLIRSEKLEKTLRWAGLLGQWFEKMPRDGIRVLGPAAAPILRLKRDYRYHFILKSKSREKLNAVLRAMLAYAIEQKIPRSSLVIDVDALSLM
jgi:primosomal protein N' (replication factor Y)